ncbi:MAG TPA: nucleotide exchange factor GrpE [Bacilli bacterium]
MNYNEKSAAAERKEMNPEAVADSTQEATYPGDEMESEPQTGVSEEQDEAGFSDKAAQDDIAQVIPGPLEELQKKVDENYQRFLRTQADFDNFRRRAKQEREEFAKYASSQLMELLLPVLDNLERALSAGKESKDPEALTKGVDMTLRQMIQALEQQGLKPMEAVGQPFNPDFHQAVMQVESEEFEEGYVVEEIQKGFMLKDRVLRPAMVKVSS